MEEGRESEPKVRNFGQSERSGLGLQSESSGVAHDGWIGEEASASTAAEEEGAEWDGRAAADPVEQQTKVLITPGIL